MDTGIAILLYVLGVLGAAVLSALTVAYTEFGKRAVGIVFDKSFADHEAALRFLGDRATRSNEREFEALNKAWEWIEAGYRLTWPMFPGLIQAPNWTKNSEAEIRDYLLSEGMTAGAVDRILKASEPTMEYARELKYVRSERARIAVFKAHKALSRGGIFMPEALEKELDDFVEFLFQTQRELNGRQSLQDPKFGTGKPEQFQADGANMLRALKAKVRARLHKADMEASPVMSKRGWFGRPQVSPDTPQSSTHTGNPA